MNKVFINKVLGIFLLFICVILILLFAISGEVNAGAGNCLNGSIKLDYSSDHYEYDISGYELDKIALKAGSECFTEEVVGCYTWEVKNDILVVDRIGDGNQCKAISHIEFTLKEVEVTNTPIPTNTPKPTRTPRPTVTNTPKPTKTDKPDPTPTKIIRITDTPGPTSTDDPDDPNPTTTSITPTISFLLGTSTPTATSETDCKYKEEKSCNYDYGCSKCGYQQYECQQCQIPPSSILIENFTDIEGLIASVDRVFFALLALLATGVIGLTTRRN